MKWNHWGYYTAGPKARENERNEDNLDSLEEVTDSAQTQYAAPSYLQPRKTPQSASA